MGLSKKLRETVEKVVSKYVGDEIDSLCETLGAHLQRIESLETEVSRLVRKVDGPGSLRVPNPSMPGTQVDVEMQTSSALAKIAAFMTNEGIYNCKGETPNVTADIAIQVMRDALGTSDSESLHSQVHRLAQFIMNEIPGEPSESEGAVDTAIRLLREGAKQEAWTPSRLLHVMPKARLNSPPLPNEVPVLLMNVGYQNSKQIVMLVRECTDLPNAVAYGLLLVDVPIPGGSIRVLAPADVQTPLTSHIYEKGNSDVAYVIAHFYGVAGLPWLPKTAELEFVRGHGIPLSKAVQLYGEHVAEVALIGQSFIEVQIIRPPQPEAAPESPAAPPAAPQSP